MWIWELDYKESWAPKNWCFWTVVLEETLESSLDFREIQPVHPKGDQSWMFSRRTDAEAETPILRRPDAKSWVIGKDTDSGKDWGHKEKGTTEDEMVGWHHQLNGHEFEPTPGDSKGQGSLMCCSTWGHKELWTLRDMTEWLINSKYIYMASLVVQTVKNLSAMQETWVRSLSQEDLLKKGTTTYFSILAWKILWTEEPGGLQSVGLQRAK